MRVFLLALLFSVATSAQPATFVFEAGGKHVEGIVSLPSGSPRGLILYFHRAIEDRSAAGVWGELLTPHGYAVAGYTATASTNYVEEARAAVRALRGRKELTQVPLVAMGASMGGRAAARWFGADPEAAALILLVPGGAEETCADLARAAGRPVLVIQAEKDEVVDLQAA
ncbi:MAG TPA: hypothetical protein VLR94_09145, partial [Acidobacteriota bacterium]|nr:hypothetical protein [Acidobacteriota bacterium]